MPAKKGSPEAKAWAEKMKQAREAKQAGKQKISSPSQPSTSYQSRSAVPPQPSEPAQQENVADLVRRVEELEKERDFFKKTSLETPQVTDRGVQGTFEKYSVDPSNYPDPRQHLWEYMNSTQALRRHGFTPDNYEMEWEIRTTNYETRDGRSVKEPRFILEVWGILYNEETNQPEKKYRIHRLVFHEDPQAALIVANEKGLEIPEDMTKQFLDDMRFLRVRDWLMELFVPPHYNEKKQEQREEVIGNKLVDVVEISSEQPSSIPFSDLKNKL